MSQLCHQHNFCIAIFAVNGIRSGSVATCNSCPCAFWMYCMSFGTTERLILKLHQTLVQKRNAKRLFAKTSTIWKLKFMTFLLGGTQHIYLFLFPAFCISLDWHIKLLRCWPQWLIHWPYKNASCQWYTKCIIFVPQASQQCLILGEDHLALLHVTT